MNEKRTLGEILNALITNFSISLETGEKHRAFFEKSPLGLKILHEPKQDTWLGETRPSLRPRPIDPFTHLIHITYVSLVKVRETSGPWSDTCPNMAKT